MTGSRTWRHIGHLVGTFESTECSDYFAMPDTLPSKREALWCARLTCHFRASTICAYVRCRVHVERLLSLCGPERAGLFALIAL
jgi:hypothetical protein